MEGAPIFKFFLKLWDTESVGRRILKTNKFVFFACIVALVVTILLITIQYYYIPLGVDGGWYSYPALSLSRGGDPKENTLNRKNIGKLKNMKGVKASFRLDFRQSVRLFPMSWWFKIFGTNFWTVRLFGIFELFLLMCLAYALLRKISNYRNIALLCWAIYFMDGIAISLGSRDLRADIMLTIMTLIVFLFTCIELKKYRILVFIFGILSIFLLTLVRVNSAIPLAFLISYIITELFISWKHILKFKKGFYISLIIVGIMSFLFRKRLWNMLIPTQFPHYSPLGMEKYVYTKMTRGIFLIIEKEFCRWMGYFFKSNIGELLAVLLAFFLFILYLFGPLNKKSKPVLISIPIGCLFAVGVLTLIDPTKGAAHALPVVFFFIVILALELEITHNPKIKYLSVCLLYVLVLLSAGIKIAQGTKIIRKGIQNNYNNTAVINVINDIFNRKDKNYEIIGPTELWPYFNPKTNVVIVDVRSNLKRIPYTSSADFIKSVDFIILNNDYAGYNWENQFRNRFPDIKLKIIAEVGDPKSGWHFVKIIKPYLSLNELNVKDRSKLQGLFFSNLSGNLK